MAEAAAVDGKAATCPTTQRLLLRQGHELPTPWGAFVVGQCVGRNESNEVWTAALQASGKPQQVAIKVYSSRQQHVLAGMHEASMHKDVREKQRPTTEGSHLVNYMGYFLVSGAPSPHVVLVFEQLGPSLVKLASSFQTATRQRRVQIAGVVLYHILLALRELHAAGLAHGDVKPENVLSSGSDMSAVRFKLVDFNHCTRVGEEGDDNGTPRRRIGTLWYRAPELLRGDRHAVHTAVDLWSAACVAAEVLCCGRPLFGVSAAADADVHEEDQEQQVLSAIVHSVGCASPQPSDPVSPALRHLNASPAFSVASSSACLSTAPSTPGSQLTDCLDPPHNDASSEMSFGSISPRGRYPTAGSSLSLTSYASAVSTPPATQVHSYVFRNASSHSEAMFQDLLRGLLACHPGARLTAEQALAHPFFQNASPATFVPLEHADAFRAQNMKAHAAFCHRGRDGAAGVRALDADLFLPLTV